MDEAYRNIHGDKDGDEIRKGFHSMSNQPRVTSSEILIYGRFGGKWDKTRNERARKSHRAEFRQR